MQKPDSFVWSIKSKVAPYESRVETGWIEWAWCSCSAACDLAPRDIAMLSPNCHQSFLTAICSTYWLGKPGFGEYPEIRLLEYTVVLLDPSIREDSRDIGNQSRSMTQLILKTTQHLAWTVEASNEFPYISFLTANTTSMTGTYRCSPNPSYSTQSNSRAEPELDTRAIYLFWVKNRYSQDVYFGNVAQ